MQGTILIIPGSAINLSEHIIMTGLLSATEFIPLTKWLLGTI